MAVGECNNIIVLFTGKIEAIYDNFDIQNDKCRIHASI